MTAVRAAWPAPALAVARSLRAERRQADRYPHPVPLSASRAVRGGCGPHCQHTSNTTIYHCGCSQCHGTA